MATYMQQTLCFVTEEFNPQGVSDREALKESWLAAFGRLSFVHFASLSVLPGVGDEPPSLALELGIDDGIEADEAASRLIDAAPAELWALYMTAPDPGPGPERGDKLRKTLEPLAKNARATGGFVGMRDRSAVQVRAEQRWFLVARNKLRAIRAQALADPDPPEAGELVNRLLLALRADPAWAAMSSPPPCSWWRQRRPFALQLLLALVWVVLPLPLLACIVALLGLLTESGLGLWPGAEAVFSVGGIFAIVVLGTAVALGLGVVVVRRISVTVALVLASLAGILIFYVELVAVYLHNLPTDHFFRRPEARVVDGLLLAALLGLWQLWRLIRRARSVTVTLWVGRGVALAGMLAAGYLLGAAWNNSLEWPRLPSWAAVSYGLPWLGGGLLIWRSSAARWYFALGLPLILLLLLLLPPAMTLLASMQQSSGVQWFEINVRRHFALGALALVDLLLLLGVLGSAAALLALRTPRRPLGVPLLIALLVMLLGHVLVAALVLRLLKPAPDVWPLLGHVQTYVWVLAGLAGTGLSVLLLLLLTSKLLRALAGFIDQADRPFANVPFMPARPSAGIVANEAEQMGGANHMISLTDVRGRRWGWNWMMTWMWLHVVGAGGMLVYTQGPLGTAQGIQFAHWHLVQQGRRLLFLSNYDGDFSGYLDEFIRGTSQGINLIWRWTTLNPRRGVDAARRFPPTRGLAFSGCHHEQAFKAYARASMVPHLVRYRAYDSSCRDIERCTRLREALAGARTPHNDNLVLTLLGS